MTRPTVGHTVLLMVFLHLLPVQALAQNPMPHPSSQTAPSELSSQLESYVQQSLANNPSLRSQAFNLQAETQALEALKKRYSPELALKARVSLSEGGRTIDFPAGDLLNPVYETLNQQSEAQGQGRPFPTISNQSVPLLRPTEQDTRLVLNGPLIAPFLDKQIDAQTENTAARQAEKARFEQMLERDVRKAWWQLTQARSQVDTLRISLNTLVENERVNRALYEAGQVTLDAPERAKAQRLQLEISLNRAELAARLAREYFNHLRAVPPDEAVSTPDTHALRALQHQIPTAEQLLTENPSKSLDLERTDRSIAALAHQRQASLALYRPSVNYQIEAGHQGEEYSDSNGRAFASASVVLSWTLFDGERNRSEASQIQARQDALRAQREAVLRQLQLAQTQAQRNLLISLEELEAQNASVRAAEETYRISERKRNAGEISQVEFLSAEQLRTQTTLGLLNTISQIQIDIAEWQFSNQRLTEAPRAGDAP